MVPLAVSNHSQLMQATHYNYGVFFHADAQDFACFFSNTICDGTPDSEGVFSLLNCCDNGGSFSVNTDCSSCVSGVGKYPCPTKTKTSLVGLFKCRVIKGVLDLKTAYTSLNGRLHDQLQVF